MTNANLQLVTPTTLKRTVMPRRLPNHELRPREHLTEREVEKPFGQELIAALEAVERRGEYVVVTQYGKPFSVKALGMRMQDWTKRAGIPPGYSLHGLRKTLGKMLAESGATTREIMSILGHDSIAHAELYTREAEQKKLASAGMQKLAKRRGELAG
jgi:integrase